MTYKELFKLLEAIAADGYWQRVPAEQRCLHILPSLVTVKAEPLKPQLPESLPVSKFKRDVSAPKRVKQQIAEIVLSSSGDESSSSLDESYSSSSSATLPEERKKAKSSQASGVYNEWKGSSERLFDFI